MLSTVASAWSQSNNELNPATRGDLWGVIRFHFPNAISARSRDKTNSISEEIASKMARVNCLPPISVGATIASV